MLRGGLTLAFILLAGPLASQGLPVPSGTFSIGTTVLRLQDSSRSDLLRPDLPRSLTVQLWYPGSSGASHSARYVLEPALLDTLIATGYYGQDSTLLRGWGTLRTHAIFDAVPWGSRHPL